MSAWQGQIAFTFKFYSFFLLIDDYFFSSPLCVHVSAYFLHGYDRLLLIKQIHFPFFYLSDAYLFIASRVCHLSDENGCMEYSNAYYTFHSFQGHDDLERKQMHFLSCPRLTECHEKGSIAVYDSFLLLIWDLEFNC